MEEGSKLVFESGQTLEKIVGSVAQVSEVVAETTIASQEQRSGIAQVNTAIDDIDEMIQKNSPMVEEAAAASTTLTSKTQNLNQLLSYFNTNNQQSPTG